jgi:hypothetical protein
VLFGISSKLYDNFNSLNLIVFDGISNDTQIASKDEIQYSIHKFKNMLVNFFYF